MSIRSSGIREQIVEDFARHIGTDPAALCNSEDHNKRFMHWQTLTNELMEKFKELGMEFNKAFHKDTPLMHILMASPYLTIEDKRAVIRKLRSVIPGTDTDILDKRENTTLHYFLNKLNQEPTVILLESAINLDFLESMFSSKKEVNSTNIQGKTVVDLLNDIILEGVTHNIKDVTLKEELARKFHEVLPELQDLQKKLIAAGAKTANQL